MDDFDTNHDGKVSLDEFLSALTRMRASLKNKDSAAMEYKSYNQLTSDRYKHVRMKDGTDQKYKVPLTFN